MGTGAAFKVLQNESNQVAIYAFKKGYRILPNGHVVSPRNIERKTVPQYTDRFSFISNTKSQVYI